MRSRAHVWNSFGKVRHGILISLEPLIAKVYLLGLFKFESLLLRYDESGLSHLDFTLLNDKLGGLWFLPLLVGGRLASLHFKNN